MSFTNGHVHKLLPEFLKFFEIEVWPDLEEVYEPLCKILAYDEGQIVFKKVLTHQTSCIKNEVLSISTGSFPQTKILENAYFTLLACSSADPLSSVAALFSLTLACYDFPSFLNIQKEPRPPWFFFFWLRSWVYLLIDSLCSDAGCCSR